ncbi:MAG: SnoaL-like polyketide cyclase [Thermoproteota archaeon]|nr:SnoaL-like polyketide cyclase [Thermoproteota archaeon]
MSGFFDAVSDIHLTIEGIITEGDKIAVRYTLTGANKGNFNGFPPTNEKLTI